MFCRRCSCASQMEELPDLGFTGPALSHKCQTKKSRPEPGESGGKSWDAFKSVQSGPADQFHRRLLQVKIAGQYGLDITRIRGLLHRAVQLNNAAEFVATAIIGVRQNELGVVLRGHGPNLRRTRPLDCEPEHKFPVTARQTAKI
jgi:hypothetical protein